jgi:hypothetical protein
MAAIRIRVVLVLLATLQACNAAPENFVVEPAEVSREQFGALRWLVGDWRGSGGQYPAFFERYQWLNDSTIAQLSFSDSTFSVATDSSELERRGGSMQKSRDGVPQHVVTRISDDSLHFAPTSGRGGGFAWVKESPDRWTAILAPATEGGEPTIYRLERVHR